MSFLYPKNNPVLPSWDTYGRTWKDAQGWGIIYMTTLRAETP